MTDLKMDNKWIAMIAAGFSGIVAGSMAFVSAVDTRSFRKHVETNDDEEDSDLAVRHFQVWWPCGRDFMVPLIGCTALANGAAYYATKDRLWVSAGLLTFLIGPYTALVLGEDIEKLRNSSTKEVAETTKRFCLLHHARLGLGLAGFGLALVGLVNLPRKN